MNKALPVNSGGHIRWWHKGHPEQEHLWDTCQCSPCARYWVRVTHFAYVSASIRMHFHPISNIMTSFQVLSVLWRHCLLHTSCHSSVWLTYTTSSILIFVLGEVWVVPGSPAELKLELRLLASHPRSWHSAESQVFHVSQLLCPHNASMRWTGGLYFKWNSQPLWTELWNKGIF